MSGLTQRKNVRSVSAEVDLPLEASQVWARVSDISNYPDFVEFMKLVSVEGDFREGSHWSDISTVMYFPLKFRHKIDKIEEGKNVYYLIDLPRGGKILQRFEIIPNGESTRVRLTIDVDLNNQLMDILLGKLIESRTKSMVGGTFKNISSWIEIEKGVRLPYQKRDEGIFARKWYLAPVIISVAAFVVLALVFGSNPSEIKAAPGKIMSKSETLVVTSASKLKNKANRVNDQLEDLILK